MHGLVAAVLLMIASSASAQAPAREVERGGAVLKCRDLAYQLARQGEWGALGNRFLLGERQAYAAKNVGPVSWTDANVEINSHARSLEIDRFIDLFER